jgi:multidrug transporter EmrE-like cation transporter
MEIIIVIGIMVLLTIIGAFGSILLKKGAAKFHLNFSLKGLIDFLTNWDIIFGGILYFLSMVGFIYLLKQQELSVLYPLTSISYIFVTIFSVWLLKEKINSYKIIGIALIIFGVWMVTLH